MILDKVARAKHYEHMEKVCRELGKGITILLLLPHEEQNESTRFLSFFFPESLAVCPLSRFANFYPLEMFRAVLPGRTLYYERLYMCRRCGWEHRLPRKR